MNHAKAEPAIRVERRDDGSMILTSTQPLPAGTHGSFADFLLQWAQRRGSIYALCERDAAGGWRRITWREFWEQAQAVAAALLEMKLGQGRPLMLLCEFKAFGWIGLLAPANVPAPVLARIEKEARAAVQTTAMKARIQVYGAEPVGSSSAEFRREVETMSPVVEKMIKSSNIKFE